jgi:hypothetical protein
MNELVRRLAVETLGQAVESLVANGPTMVVVKTWRGHVEYADTPENARKAGISSDVIFIRADGWTLGARAADEKAARDLWDKRWVGRLEVATREVTAL